MKLEPYKQLTPLLQQLFSKKHKLSKSFFENLVTYNNSFACASVVCKIVEPPGHSTVFKGRIHHKISSLHPDPNKTPCFGQYYILSTNDAIRERNADPYTVKCDAHKFELFSSLTKMFDESKCNPFMQMYKTMHQVEKDITNKARLNNQPIPIVRMFIDDVQPGQHIGIANIRNIWSMPAR